MIKDLAKYKFMTTLLLLQSNLLGFGLIYKNAHPEFNSMYVLFPAILLWLIIILGKGIYTKYFLRHFNLKKYETSDLN